MTQSRSSLSERYIQDSFHSYLKSSLTQAKAERLLDADVLSSAESDLMITGPALCLYFAALRCTTNPPSVPLPRSNKAEAPIELSYDNCPPAFIGFLQVWASTVPVIQSFVPEHQHDLARVICGLDPLSQPMHPAIGGIAADLRAVAIEISQRRSFQDRFASDLQAALDSGTTPGSPGAKKASFVPPPLYDPTPSNSTRTSLESPSSLSPPRSPSRTSQEITPTSPSHLSPRASSSASNPRRSVSPSPSHLSPTTSSSTRRSASPSPSHLSPPASASSSSFPRRSTSPSVLTPNSPAIEFIRETLYASLADALERQPSLRTLLKRDPPRAYFASVAYAILDVATTSITPDGSVVGVLGTPLTLSDCPRELRPFMMELAAIGVQAKEMEDADNETAMQYAQRGEDIPSSKMDRVKKMLEEGVGYAEGRREAAEGRRSIEGRAVAFTNRINALSLGMTRLKAFRERQEEVFKVLGGIGS